ncbi:MAG: PEGA domain-containing protein [Candidatus Omnitrophica bacterium]|nr:PEGA domain-containing protein [Candidatus Omnitrophota bacterium]
MKKFFMISGLLILVLTVSGCVRRIVSIDSQPPGAEVYLGRRLIGKTPCTHEFLYYGTHYLELAKEGHLNIKTTVKLNGPFYEYFPFSVISELLIPWQITDVHSYDYKLEEGESEEPIISPIEEPQSALSELELLYK